MSVIAIAAFGTLGDMYPYFQLGSSLKQRGHRILLATSTLYQPKTTELGFTFFPLRPDLENFKETIDDLAEKLMDPSSGAEFLYKECLMPGISQTYQDIFALADGADILITHPLILAASLVAEKKPIRWISTVLAPISMMSAYDPPVLSISIANKLKFGPKISGWIIGMIKKKLSSWSKPVDELRADLGLKPNKDPLFEGQHSERLALALFSEVFGPSQPDWPENVAAPGFIFYDDAANQSLSPELIDFLNEGPPPVVFTLGSSAVFRAGSFFDESIAAIDQLKYRAVILSGLTDKKQMLGRTVSSNIFITSYAPHALLFKYAAVVVHHGGVGTTAQVMRAGIPALVVPHAHDQPDNASRVKKLGVGELIAAENYNAKKIVPILKKLMENPLYKDQAKAVAGKLLVEDGISSACRIIEEQIAKP